MKKALLFLLTSLIIIVDSYGQCDTSTAFTTHNLRVLDSIHFSTCGENQFHIETDLGNVTWYEGDMIRGGGNVFYANKPGVYYGVSEELAKTCTYIGPIHIKQGEKPQVELNYASSFFCFQGEGVELTVLAQNVLVDSLKYEWYKNYNDTIIGADTSILFANENATYRVVINDKGCEASSEQVMIQGKDCENEICPTLNLQQNGLIEIESNEYRFCEQSYVFNAVGNGGSFEGYDIHWFYNDGIIDIGNKLEGKQSGVFKVVVNDNLICKDSVQFKILEGGVSSVNIVGVSEGKEQYCNETESGATLKAQAQPETGIRYTWYKEDNDQWGYISNMQELTNISDGKYLIVIANDFCDSLDSEIVEVKGIDCEKDCLMLTLRQNGLLGINDTVYRMCQDNFSLYIESGNSNIYDHDILWYKDSAPIYFGSSYHVQNVNTPQAGKYSVVVDDEKGCVNTLEFEISVAPFVNVEILNESPYLYCEEEYVELEADYTEVQKTELENFYFQWYKKDNDLWNNVGNGQVYSNVQEQGVYKVVLGAGNCPVLSESEIELVTDCILTSAFDNSDTKNIVVFPNPASEFLFVKGDNIDKVRVVDIMGRELLTSTSTELDVSLLRTGSYFVEVTANGIVDRLMFSKK